MFPLNSNSSDATDESSLLLLLNAPGLALDDSLPESRTISAADCHKSDQGPMLFMNGEHTNIRFNGESQGSVENRMALEAEKLWDAVDPASHFVFDVGE